MNSIIKILFLLVSNLILAQKEYNIGNMSWTYEKPPTYLFKKDNFAEAAKKGKEIFEQKADSHYNLNPEDTVLFSIAKDENSDFNILVSNYLTDDNIKNFGFEGYTEELIKIFTNLYYYLKIETEVTKEKIEIDGQEFYIIKNTISLPDKNYKQYLYVGKIGNKELQISTTFDDEIDEKLLLDSILNSKFH